MARRQGSGRALYGVGVVAIVVAVVAVVMFWRERDSQLAQAREARAAAVDRGPRIQVVTVAQGPRDRSITLLGDARPYQTVTLYGKIGGYLKTIAVDRGDKVQTGQIVAEIEAQETDNQYASALADLENKRRLSVRARELLARGTMSTQASEQSETDMRMAQARVSELATLKSYEIIRAPFAGTVTARFVDRGAMITNAASNQASSQPVLTISDGSRLRVGVYVEQQDVPFIRVDDAAEVVDAANPSRRVMAKISRTAGDLDPRTRTLLVEVDVDNRDQFLVPGSFVYVTLRVPVPSYAQIPATALVQRGGASFVAGVGEDGLVRFRPIKVAGTDGVQVNIAEGVRPGERVAVNLPDEVTEGGRIQPVVTRTP
jgi:RND family efflux transporter MFP subunit